MSKSTQFFATRKDVVELFRVVEENASLQFAQAGRFNSPIPTVFHKSKDIPALGIASHGDAVRCDAYLVSMSGLTMRARELSSAPFFAFDQLENPKSIIFWPGGLWKNEILIRGSVGTASHDPSALALMKIFNGALKKSFIRIRGVFVGPEATALWKQGKRLTGAAQSPVEFDLAYEGTP